MCPKNSKSLVASFEFVSIYFMIKIIVNYKKNQVNCCKKQKAEHDCVSLFLLQNIIAKILSILLFCYKEIDPLNLSNQNYMLKNKKNRKLMLRMNSIFLIFFSLKGMTNAAASMYKMAFDGATIDKGFLES
ncbi:hypothetical protein BpHYR1_010404 [Brachionus plicatilis]|uniref:Uncharacterized protein n=1 Tax=Brachionus plicatilis TaxID=10195 RepID=A0A3M7QF09_BRAPC|nr:hypothetical protein BpHYR1_010404 [Brachionus plicatilis]